MKYPGRIIRSGESDAAIVKAIKVKLNAALHLDGDPALKLDPANPNFGPKMKQVVKLFQARNVDEEGRPLKQDGEVGANTWGALFGDTSVPHVVAASDALLKRALEIAIGEEAKKVREVPRNSNRGPQVEQYLKRAGVPAGLPWCCAFLYWCFDEAAKSMGRANPLFKTAGCMMHWQKAPTKGAARILSRDAIANPGLVKPGHIFIMDHGRGMGHTGIVERVAGGLLTTIEGNTDASRTREGGGVYRLSRKVQEINKGYLDYSGR